MGSKTDIGQVDGHLVSAEISGNVWKLLVEEGSQVSEGQPLLIVEAMKTMNQIPAPKAGTVKRILVEDGAPVEFGAPLMVVE